MKIKRKLVRGLTAHFVCIFLTPRIVDVLKREMWILSLRRVTDLHGVCIGDKGTYPVEKGGGGIFFEQ